MVFPGFKSTNWMATALFCNVAIAAYWEFCGAYMSPLAAICFPQVMGKYDAGIVKGVNERGNAQYLRPKVAYDSKPADYSKYTQDQ